MSKTATTVDPLCPSQPSPSVRLPRYIRRQNRARTGGLATLAVHGVEHFRAMSALGAAARRANPRPSREIKERVHFSMTSQQVILLRTISESAGISQSEFVRRAIASYVETLAAQAGLAGEATPGAKPPAKNKRPR